MLTRLTERLLALLLRWSFLLTLIVSPITFADVFNDCKKNWGTLPSPNVQQEFRKLLGEFNGADAYILIEQGMADYGYFDGQFVAIKDDRVMHAWIESGEILRKSFPATPVLKDRFLDLKEGFYSGDYTKSVDGGLHPTCKIIEVKVGEVYFSFQTTYSLAWVDDYMLRDLKIDLPEFDRALRFFLKLDSSVDDYKHP
ncbi:hypothetical protein QT397_17565 [Microbulbifer sp. MKSA007]|nr:hypothetical protein QT397_17565 [Microbulbifer sp. MKSA007]